MARPRGNVPRAAVAFNEQWWDTDTGRLPRPVRDLAARTRRALERDGLALDPAAVYRCDPEGRDGTSLPNCVKVYLDDHRIVFEVTRNAHGRLVLTYLALGPGHPPATGRQPSVYQTADRRLHGR